MHMDGNSHPTVLCAHAAACSYLMWNSLKCPKTHVLVMPVAPYSIRSTVMEAEIFNYQIHVL